MSKFDTSSNAFQSYKQSYNQVYTDLLSESDTRSKLIDFIFKDILGWSENNIRREGHVDSGYFDYIISLNNFQFVVEAKKQAVVFNVPIKGRRHKIKSLYKENKEVFDQIRGYLLDIGLTHGVITNGTQFIISKFVNIDGTSWKDNDALLFQSLEKLEENFIDFYNLISYEAIEQNGRIKIQVPPEFSQSLINEISNRNQELYRNDFSSKLLPVIDKIFNEIGNTDDIDTNRSLLESCYVPSIDIHKYSGELAGLFLDLPPSFDSKISKAKQTDQVTINIKKDIGSNTNIPSPIILIGGKGAGKTTFIRYFFNVVLSNKESREIPSVYLDFRNYTHQQIDDTASIYKTILNSLLIEHDYLNLGDYSILKQIFKHELELKLKGVFSTVTDKEILEEKISNYISELTNDPMGYLISISKYLQKFQRRKLCLIFDNADQLDNESQKKIFLLSQSLRGTLSSIVFVSLREGYFYQWKNKPPFDAFHSNIYHISAPPYSSVLKKRILYIINKVVFDPIHTFVDNKTIDFGNKTLKDFFKNMYHTLFSTSSNSEIMRYLEQTSYPNIRKGLEEMNNFLVSGHTKIDSYITSQPNIPIWEFVKSIGLNNKLYYMHKTSAIYNIFYPNHPASDHFIKIRILKYLFDIAKSKGFKEEFISTESIIETFVLASYSRDCVIDEIDSLLQNHLLMSDNHHSDIELPDKITTDTSIQISNRGLYYFNDLIYRFHYLDLVLQDTPIFNKTIYDSMLENFAKSDTSGKRSLTKRVKTVEIFISYLLEQEVNLKRKSENASELELLDFNASKYLSYQFYSVDKPRIDKALYNK